MGLAEPLGALTEIEFEIKTPVSDEVIAGHVRHALSLGLPSLQDERLGNWGLTPLHVVANGPSARSAPYSAPTCALNNALRLFTDQGKAPTYWAACDPQELVADFLVEIPERTVYLVASKCHPAVFERLKNRRVVVWHVDEEASRPLVPGPDLIASFVSITATIPEVLARLGWRELHFWGWDGCFLDGAGHATPQALGADAQAITVEVGEEKHRFETTTSWALEAQSAVGRLSGWPFPIHVHGPGMMGAILKTYHPSKVLLDMTRS